MRPRYRQQPWVRAREPLNHTSIWLFLCSCAHRNPPTLQGHGWWRGPERFVTANEKELWHFSSLCCFKIASHIRVVVWPPSQRCGRGGWQHALFRYKVVGEREPLGHNPPPPTARGVCRCAADQRPSALSPDPFSLTPFVCSLPSGKFQGGDESFYDLNKSV
jgi:hypothetical protein